MGIKYTKANHFLYQKICVEEVITTKELEQKTTIPRSTWYNWTEGISTVPPDIFKLLYLITHDLTFLTFFTDGTDQMLTPRQKSAGDKGILEETLDVSEALGKVVHEVKKGLEDDSKLDSFEKARIRKAANVAHKEIEDLIKCMDGK